MYKISRIQKAIHGESLDGWLFCNFSHRDRLTDHILGLESDRTSTRTWYYLIPVSGDPVKIVHTIEQDVLSPLPGTIITYTGQKELALALSRFSGKKFAVLNDETLTVISTISAAHLSFAQSCGIQTQSASRLMQRISAFESDADRDSHEKAAKVLHTAVFQAWEYLSRQIVAGIYPFEREIRDLLLANLAESGMITDHPPIVGTGKNTANPHYHVPDHSRGDPIRTDMPVQFDIWGKFPGGMYADISWVGYTGRHCPDELADHFALVRDARDLVVPYIEQAFSDNRNVTGSELDSLVRTYLSSRADPSWIRHRTGHAIDHACHGSGVNLDCIEFPDNRPVIEGSCFSVEPGLYGDRFGMRTEIDVYIHNGKPVISGLPIQNTILVIQD